MSEIRPLRRWSSARIVWVITALLMVVWVPLGLAHGVQEASGFGFVIIPLVIMGFATVGALITSRQPENRIGLIYALLALAGAVGVVGGAYAQPGAGEGVFGFRVAAWVGREGFALMLAPLPFIFLLFPDGHVPTRRWRPVLWAMLAATAINQIGYALAPGPVAAGFSYTPRSVTNPFGLPASWARPVADVTTLAGTAIFIGGVLGALALVLRYRRAEREQRQQIRWLAYVGAAAGSILITGLILGIAGPAVGVKVSDSFFPFVLLPFAVVIMVGTPAASVIAVMRYHLYDLDVVVKKTVVAGLLIVLMGVVALAVVAAVGQFALYQETSSVVSVAVGIAIGLLCIPVLRLSRRIADRIVYGGRATPYEVLTQFSGRMSETYSTEDVLPRMAAILGAGTGAAGVVIWLLIDRTLRPVAAWPDAADTPAPFPAGELDGREAFEVRHQGEQLGAITVAMPANDPMNPNKERVIKDLATQAGLVLRNVRLIEDLRESRRRLVAAQDEERRKIERNIHDGAQQQLVALSVQLRLTDQVVERDPAKAHEMLVRLQAATSEALEDLRDLARGIYPPLLADKGLPAALEAQARKAAVVTRIESDGVGRYPQDIESAVYFCVLEALQNIAKYAEATSADIRLCRSKGILVFEVSDNGRGFDSATAVRGSGLQGMADRLDAVGGSLEVNSRPGAGTTVRGSVPAGA